MIWKGKNKDGKEWTAKIDDERFMFELIVGDEFYFWTLDEFINEKHNYFKGEQFKAELLEAVFIAKEKEKNLHSGLKSNWVDICDCTICSNWPEQLHDDLSTISDTSSSRFPPEVEKLIYVSGHRRYSSPEINICPQCGTYYKIENEYEWTTIGNYDDDYLTRLTPKEALELLPETGKAVLKDRWHVLMQSLQKCLLSNKAHIVEYAKKSLE